MGLLFSGWASGLDGRLWSKSSLSSPAGALQRFLFYKMCFQLPTEKKLMFESKTTPDV